MTRKLITTVCMVMLLGMLTGCGPSALQIQAEIAYYEAIASITKNQAAQPIFTLIATDATKPIVMENVAKIEVYAQSPDSHRSITQYVQKDYNEPAWRFLTTLASVVTPWVGAYYIVDSVKDMTGGANYNYNNTVAEGATGNFRVQGNTTATSSGAGAATATGMTDATSTPTIVHADVVPTEVVVVPSAEPIIVQPAK